MQILTVFHGMIFTMTISALTRATPSTVGPAPLLTTPLPRPPQPPLEKFPPPKSVAKVDSQ